MQKLIFGIAIAFIASAFGATLDELNIARDPETLEGAIYGTTVYTLNFRAGPGKHFVVLGTVPAGTEVPVVGWISGHDEEEGFWIRTEYKGKRGWLCAFVDGERLIEKEGGPLFPIKVKANKLLLEYEREGSDCIWYDMWIRKGEEIEFASLWGGSPFNPRAESIDFWVKHDAVWGHICVYATADYVDRQRSPFVVGSPLKTLSGWFVEFPPEFLQLNFEYNYESCFFDFVGPDEDKRVCGGPGFEYEDVDHWVLFGPVYFIEREWALVSSFNRWGWIRIGTDEKPNAQIYRDFAAEECPWPTGGVPEDAEYCCGISSSVRGDLWPSSNRLYLNIWSCMYDSEVAARHVVESIAVYQPSGTEEPFYLTPGFEPAINRGYESGARVYAFDVPEPFNPQAPFRLVADMHYEGAQEFVMEFMCNVGK